ncbi:TIGR03790 family protein [Burkholderiaceae bacterium UC74_6]
MTLRLPVPLLLCLALLLSACGGGGGGSGGSTPVTPSAPTLTLPQHGLTAAQLGLVVIAGDATSEAMASYYAQARGVPSANIVRVSLPAGAAGSASLDVASLQQLKAAVDAALPSTVQAVLLVWKLPFQVTGASCSMGITSAMTLGFDAKYCGGCPATAASAYYDTESTLPFTQLGLRPAMLLGTSTLADAKALIDRGVQADNSLPTGTGWLLRTSDVSRSVRYGDFSALPAAWSGLLSLSYQDNSTGSSSDSISGKSNVLFYFTGLAGMPNLGSNSYRPGAIGDSLTSYGGVLDGSSGQTMATDWIAAGLTASYGTVEEPCNWQEKFPRASVLIDHYNRGDSLIEAYWKSVQMPGQGVFVGEPLARPWPDAPSLTVSAGQYSIKTRGLRSGSLYFLQYRRPADADWTGLTAFTAQRSVTSLVSSLPPSDATQLRWLGPCASDSSKVCTLAQSN